eukprot:6299851-Amphidinium_carterae.1
MPILLLPWSSKRATSTDGTNRSYARVKLSRKAVPLATEHSMSLRDRLPPARDRVTDCSGLC